EPHGQQRRPACPQGGNRQRHHAGIGTGARPLTEDAMNVAEAAKQLVKMADQVRAPEHEFALWGQFEQLLSLEPETAEDALALVATARKLLNGCVLPLDTPYGYAQHCALLLIRNAI